MYLYTYWRWAYETIVNEINIKDTRTLTEGIARARRYVLNAQVEIDRLKRLSVTSRPYYRPYEQNFGRRRTNGAPGVVRRARRGRRKKK